MTIRSATIDDLVQLLALAEWMHKESPRWSRLSYSRERAERMMRFLLEHPENRGMVFVAERKGALLGFIAGYADAHWSSDDIVATVATYFMLPDSRISKDAELLICAMRAWGERKGAKWLHADTSIGIAPQQTAKLYEDLGFSQTSISLEVGYVYRS